MARNQVIVTVGDAWTQLTNGDATAATWQVINGDAWIAITAGATAPAPDARGFLYEKGSGEANRSLEDLTQLASANRIWARACNSASAQVLIDHA